MKKISFWLIFVFVSIVLIYKCFSFIDPDLGWHLVGGRIMLTSGIPKTDPFSYTMPSYPYINHEWLSDITLSLISNTLGIYGTSIIFGLLTAFLLCINTQDRGTLGKIIFLISTSSILPFVSLAPRIFSWFFFSLLIFIVFNQKNWKKFWYLVPLIILVWTNFHGSFPLGIFTLLVAVVFRSFKSRKLVFKESFALILSVLFTFINPYGSKIWQFVFSTVIDPKMNSRILEWQPFYKTVTPISLLLIFLFTLAIVIIYRYWQKFPKEYLVFVIFLFVISMSASRHIPFFVVTTSFLLNQAYSFFWIDIKKIKEGQNRFLKVLTKTLISVFIFLVLEVLYISYYNYFYFRESAFYPVGAINYLRTHIPNGEIFSNYNLGGYITWRLPEKKVFVNGAMTVWNRVEAPKNESNNALNDYYSVLENKADYKPIFEKYNIKTVLLPLSQTKDPLSLMMKQILPSLSLSNTDISMIKFSEKLILDGWHPSYWDQTSIILQK